MSKKPYHSQPPDLDPAMQSSADVRETVVEERTERHDAAGRKQKHVVEAGAPALPVWNSQWR